MANDKITKSLLGRVQYVRVCKHYFWNSLFIVHDFFSLQNEKKKNQICRLGSRDFRKGEFQAIICSNFAQK